MVGCNDLIAYSLVQAPKAYKTIYASFGVYASLGPGPLYQKQGSHKQVCRQVGCRCKLMADVIPTNHPSIEKPLGLNPVLPAWASIAELCLKIGVCLCNEIEIT